MTTNSARTLATHTLTEAVFSNLSSPRHTHTHTRAPEMRPPNAHCAALVTVATVAHLCVPAHVHVVVYRSPRVCAPAHPST